MKSCCVDNCEIKSKDTIFFEFPTSRSLRKRWLDVIKLSGKLTGSSAVCSQHFTEEDYETVRGKVRLKRKVVPSLLLSDSVKDPTPNPELSKEASTPPDAPLDTTSEAQTKSPERATDETENCKTNGTDRDANSDSEVSQPKTIAEEPDPKQDIEEMITNYHIKNNPNSSLAASVSEILRACEQELANASERSKANEFVDINIADATPDVIILPEVQPVFIEVPVDKDECPTGADGSGGGSQDCLMLLESVQVDIDPASLLPPDYDDDEDKAPDKKEDPISLLTSSDEDDVILEEPHIDTVEVSDETDEDDMPLTRLIQPKPRKTKKTKKSQIKGDKTLKMVMWGGYDYYCMQCNFTTPSRTEFRNHVAGHSTVLQICAICSYTTASKAQYSRHMRKHKEEKRYRCNLCGFKAKHHMSLMYHLKSHDDSNISSPNRSYKCKKCSFTSDVKSVVVKHYKLCSYGIKVFRCKECEYETPRKSDLKRHQLRKHREKLDDDDEYVP